MGTTVQVSVYVIVAVFVLNVLLAYLATPDFRRRAVAAGNTAEEWAAGKVAVSVVIKAAIDYAEENFILLSGPERMEKAVAFCAARGVPVTVAQVQQAFDAMKAFGLFGIVKKAAKEATNA